MNGHVKLRVKLAMTILSCIALPAFADDDDKMQIRVIHALAGGPAVSVSAGPQQVFSNVPYRQVTAFKPVAIEDDVRLVVRTADGVELPLADDRKLDDDHYTVLVMAGTGGDATPVVRVLETDDDDPEDIKAHITLINGSPAVGAADLGVGGDRIISGVGPGRVHGPDTLNVGNQTVTVNDAGQDKSLVSVPVSIEAGRSYTVVVFSPTEVGIVDDSVPMKTLTALPAASSATSATLSRPAATAPTNPGTTASW